MNELKDKIEIENKKIDSLDKEANIIHKKIFILLPTAGGAGYYAIDFFKIGYNSFSIFFLTIFVIMAFGIGLNYGELNKLKREVERIKNG